ncbi:eukaryotic translation initiation factor 3 subunit E-like [Panicum miliaceum]|uniref:Eukaryotic translation initiation factor 3 subunit E n=1 Tax=Panicum miliaceum TaxID=4540 RepID=A0A3L6TDE6_PANMI|nr:eukaryotic translation initiation factor 3 subunit E-like [Panicum miliaceum]
MAEHDLTARLAPHLDRHLVFPLLESLQERGLYPEEEILAAKLRLLGGTNMVDYAMAIHRSLHGTDEAPGDMVARRAEVVDRLVALQTGPAMPLYAFLRDPQLVQLLRPDKQYNVHMLQERFQIGPDQIEALYDDAKFQFECGSYSDAAAYLYQYRVLSTNSERSNFSSPLNQLQSRIWLMHWSLFIFFNHENGRNGIIDLFFQDRYLNAIQTNAHHLLRYLAIALVVNKRRRNMLKDLIKVIQQEQHSYKDPVTEFLECLYVNYDFDGAQQKLIECEQFKRLREEHIVQSILAEKLNMRYSEAELWIMNLVKSLKLDAKIDSVSGTLIMRVNRVDVHEEIIESLKNLNTRTYMLAQSIVEPAQAAQQAAQGD